MCLGGGGDKPYDAYGSGDYQKYENAFNKQSDIMYRQARGEISDAEAQRELAALANGTPGTGTHTEQVQDGTTQKFMGHGDYVEVPKYVTKTVGNPGTPGVDVSALYSQIEKDPSAAMDARELQRQRDIKLGQIGIDKNFSQFDDPYYAGYKQDYVDYYDPQLADQYDKAKGKLTAALAGRGTLESTAGAGALADLFKNYNDQKTTIANDALDAAQKLRGQVENAKSNLYALNETAADPEAVNAQAVGQATALVAPPTYSPLGQVFAAALQPYLAYQSAASNVPTRTYQSPYSTPATGRGSAKVIQ